jgi:hypothetical protein
MPFVKKRGKHGFRVFAFFICTYWCCVVYRLLVTASRTTPACCRPFNFAGMTKFYPAYRVWISNVLLLPVFELLISSVAIIASCLLARLIEPSI